tara:strand:- start:449 stop:1306 length:858 start_codon:yes stop_codon:yes gene_type:complete
MFARYASQLHDMGWNVIPLNGKRPIISQWGNYANYPPSELELQVWIRKYPRANIGLVLGGYTNIIAIDIDIDDTDICMNIQNSAADIFGVTKIVRYGRSPRAVLLYKAYEELKSSIGPVEFLSTGRQVVIFGTHPLTKKEYYYEDFTPLECEPNALPIIDVEQMQQFKNIIQQYLPKKVRTNGNPTSLGDTHYFEDLKDSRKLRNAFERRNKICEQLQGGEPGKWHNILLSCVAALAHDGCSEERILQIVEHNFNAPRTGPYSDDWANLDEIIGSAVHKFRKEMH